MSLAKFLFRFPYLAKITISKKVIVGNRSNISFAKSLLFMIRSYKQTYMHTHIYKMFMMLPSWVRIINNIFTYQNTFGHMDRSNLSHWLPFEI